MIVKPRVDDKAMLRPECRLGQVLTHPACLCRSYGLCEPRHPGKK